MTGTRGYKERQYAFTAACTIHWVLPVIRRPSATPYYAQLQFFRRACGRVFTLPTGFGLREACDLGMFAQTVMLGLTAHGLGACPQTALAFLANVIRPALSLGDHEQLMFGMSFGIPPIQRSMRSRPSAPRWLMW